MNAPTLLTDQHYRTVYDLVRQGFTIRQSIRAAGLNSTLFYSAMSPQQRLDLSGAKHCACRHYLLYRLHLEEAFELIIPDLWDDQFARSSAASILN